MMRSIVTAFDRVQLRCAFAWVALALPAAGHAQQLIGYVPEKDAEVTGAHDTVEGRAVLAGSVMVTARDRTAAIALGRGGTVRVCQTSVLHLTESRAAPTAAQLAAPLLLSLDRGAIEVEMQATPADSLMTPDLRFGVKSPGRLNLRLRTGQNGDTCVENRGPAAPTLLVSDPFGQGTYQLNSGQHVLFEHGSLREVVDNEASPCGCPDRPGMSVAEALLAPGRAASPAAAQATAQHPFPAAQSEGLAPTPEVPQAAPGQVHAQVTERLTYNGAEPTPEPPAGQGTSTSTVSTQAATAPPAPPPPPRHHIAHAIGHFFKKIFGG